MEDAEEDYSYENKRRSREEIRRYIEAGHRKFSFEPFDRLRLIILSHKKGEDLRDIYFRLGMRPENVTVVERDREVVKAMKRNPVFKGVTIVNADLAEYVPPHKYDIYHFDFKSNISQKLFDEIILRFIFHSQQFYHDDPSPSIYYLNFLGAREVKETTEQYSDLRSAARMASKSGNRRKGAIKDKFRSAREIPLDKSKHFFKAYDEFRNYETLDQTLLHLFGLLDQQNHHHVRAEYIYAIIKGFLDSLLTLPSYLTVSDEEIAEITSDPVLKKRWEDKARHHYNTTVFLRCVTGLLSVWDFRAFKYKSRKNRPFINALFVLDNICKRIKTDPNCIDLYYQCEFEEDSRFLSRCYLPSGTSLQVRLEEVARREDWRGKMQEIYSSAKRLLVQSLYSGQYFLESSLAALYGVEQYASKRIPFGELTLALERWLRQTYEIPAGSNSALTTMIRDNYLMAKKILDTLRRNKILTFGMRRGVLRGVFTFSSATAIPFKYGRESAHFHFLVFTVCMDQISKICDFLERGSNTFELRDISSRSKEPSGASLSPSSADQREVPNDVEIIYDYIDRFPEEVSSELSSRINEDLGGLGVSTTDHQVRACKKWYRERSGELRQLGETRLGGA